MSRERHDKQYAKLYMIWKGMKSRCSNPNRRDYQYYGGKGIQVYQDWANSFNAFLKWALLSGYRDGLTIERLDVSIGYFPNNCAWIPKSQQNLNKSSTTMLTAWGITRSLQEWALLYHISPKRLDARIRLGWSSEDALVTPKNGRYIFSPEHKRIINHNGEDILLQDYCSAHGLDFKIISKRISRGWSFERATNTPVIRRDRGKKER